MGIKSLMYSDISLVEKANEKASWLPDMLKAGTFWYQIIANMQQCGLVWILSILLTMSQRRIKEFISLIELDQELTQSGGNSS